MSVRLANLDDCERSGNWQLVRRTFGVKLVDIPSGEQIPEHDETGRNQEEVFITLAGSPTIVIDGEEHPAPEGTFVRLATEPKRYVINNGDAVARVLIVSAPTTSGYEPMDWA